MVVLAGVVRRVGPVLLHVQHSGLGAYPVHLRQHVVVDSRAVGAGQKQHVLDSVDENVAPYDRAAVVLAAVRLDVAPTQLKLAQGLVRVVGEVVLDDEIGHAARVHAD